MNSWYLLYASPLKRTVIYFFLYTIFFKIFICNICPCFSPLLCFVLFVPICCIYLSCFVIAIFEFYFLSIFIKDIFFFCRSNSLGKAISISLASCEFLLFSIFSTLFHNVPLSENSCGAFCGSRISVWAIPPFLVKSWTIPSYSFLSFRHFDKRKLLLHFCLFLLK